MFYGFTFAIGVESDGSDITQYVDILKNYYSNNLTTFTGLLVEHFDKGEFDFYIVVVTYIVSIFTDNYVYLTLVFAIVFGYFSSRNIKLLLENSNPSFGFIAILILLFFFVNPIFNINGVRFYTALQMFTYGFLHFIIKKDKKYLVFCFLTPIIHFSFYLAILIFSIAYLLRNNTFNVFVLYLVSILASEIFSNELISSFFSSVGFSAVDDRTNLYTNKELIDLYIDYNVTALNWYIEYLNKILSYTINFLVITVYAYLGAIIHNNKFYKEFWGYAVSIMAIGNFLSQHFVIGRYYYLGLSIIIPFFIVILSDPLSKSYFRRLGLFRNAITYSIIFFCLITFRIGLYSLSTSTFLSNPILVFFIDKHLSINDLIKGL